MNESVADDGNKKFGLTYLYQPHFAKSLGVFGESSVPIEISSFLSAIPKKYTYWDIDLNENNVVSVENKNFRYTQRTNYFLPLAEDYGSLQDHFKRLALRMTKKANEHHLQMIRTSWGLCQARKYCWYDVQYQ